jgi:hypothetical protein
MKNPQYIEGQQALENFKAFAGAVIQANPEKQKKQPKKTATTKRKSKRSDKD